MFPPGFFGPVQTGASAIEPSSNDLKRSQKFSALLILEHLVGKRPLPGAKAGHHILATGPGFDLPLRSRLAQLQGPPRAVEIGAAADLGDRERRGGEEQGLKVAEPRLFPGVIDVDAVGEFRLPIDEAGTSMILGVNRDQGLSKILPCPFTRTRNSAFRTRRVA